MNNKFERELKNAMEVSNVLFNVPAYVDLMRQSKLYNIDNGIEYENYLGSVKTTVIRKENEKEENNVELKNGNIVIKLVDDSFISIVEFDCLEGFWLYDSYMSLVVMPNEDNFKLFLKRLDSYINREVK